MSAAVTQSSQVDGAWLIGAGEGLDRPTVHGLARAWSKALPERQYMILLCEKRRNFIIAFLAAQLAGKTVLLPSNRSPGALAEVAADYPDCFCLLDDAREPAPVEQLACDVLPQQAESIHGQFGIDDNHIAATVFTSGSTGKARPNEKTWGGLVVGAHLAQQRFGFDEHYSIVATVPPQHMYGLETTVMVPLITGARIHDGRPFFPEDVRLALEACPAERVLITTPVHLRACVAAGLAWPDLNQIVSATAPLDAKLLHEAEALFAAPVREIYGCTEAGSLASRQPAESDVWQLYDSFEIEERDGSAYVSAPHLDEAVELGDMVEVLAMDRFRLQGRKQDLLNIAGKRASLKDLNLKLNAIAGVEDGTFVMPDETDAGAVTRLAALVVAPGMSVVQINAQLAEALDPVFLPRPLYMVDELPRNETGKLPRQALLELLDKLGETK